MPSLSFTPASARFGGFLGALWLLISAVAASNMTYYAPSKGVDPAFANWINQFYTAAEAANTTEYGFQEFFSRNATIDLGGWNPAQDVIDGLTVRVHYPTKVTATEDAGDTTTLFDLFGLTKGYYQNGSCLVDSYETRFTVEKENCRAVLVPRSGSLVVLNLVVQTPLRRSCSSF